MKTVTKQQHEAAKYSSNKLQPLANAMAAIDDQALGYNQEAIQKFNEFCNFISDKMLEAASVIAQAKQQYENRDIDLINAASLRFFQIDNDIEAAKHRQQSLKNLYAGKVEELRKKKFSDEEIARIVERPDEEIAALEVIIGELKKEKKKTQQFLADAPHYNEEYLAGTRVFDLLENRRALGMTSTVVG